MKTGDLVGFLIRLPKQPKIVKILTMSTCGRYAKVRTSNGTTLVKAADLKPTEQKTP